MNESTLRTIMYLLMSVGAALVLIGIGMIMFTNIYLDKGADGVLLIAGLIASGLFLLLPSKIFLTLQLMKKNDEKRIKTLEATQHGSRK